jgi:hypothetical protein
MHADGHGLWRQRVAAPDVLQWLLLLWLLLLLPCLAVVQVRLWDGGWGVL